MRTHRFGRKIELPATIAIKHQIGMRMAQYEVQRLKQGLKYFADNPAKNCL